MATGRTPFGRDASDPNAYVQLQRRAQPIRRVRRLPPKLADAIDSCLEPDPTQRPTVRALAELFDSLL